ncbi:MAG: AIM24 family protein [Desulfotomaculum sp.]|nr:AIM24 family protein [Desulfotomaculum sp.]
MKGNFEYTVEGNTLIVEGTGVFYAKLGAMVADKGNFKYSKKSFGVGGSSGGVGGFLGQVASHAMRSVTGEKMDTMMVEGNGKCYLADRACHISVIDLEPSGAWQSICVEASDILAFSDTCKCDVVMLGSGSMQGKGLFTTKFTYNGDGAKVAVRTMGAPIMLEAPCKVDPDACVAWTGREPRMEHNITFSTLIGRSSGETFVLSFEDAGQLVVVQPYERNPKEVK